MAEESRGKLTWMLIRNGLLLLASGYVVYLILKPAEKVEQLHQYLGDPTTGCVYPVEKLDISKLLMYGEGGLATHWDEFVSLKQANDAGYQLCR